MPSNQHQYRYIQQDLSEPESQVFTAGKISLFTCRAPDKDSPNEDAIALIPFTRDSGVLLVADGLGGAPAGKEASRVAVDCLSKTVSDAMESQLPLREAILNGIEAANQTLLDLAIGAATTLALIEVQGNTIRPYHVGDSMILVVGQRGKIKFRAISHSPIGYAMESGLLDETEAAHHEERHIVSNVVGTPEMRIDIGPNITLAPYDTVVLASDGLCDNLYESEIVEYMRKGALDKVAHQLMQASRQRMQQPLAGQPSKPDDLSFILFRLAP